MNAGFGSSWPWRDGWWRHCFHTIGWNIKSQWTTILQNWFATSAISVLSLCRLVSLTSFHFSFSLKNKKVFNPSHGCGRHYTRWFIFVYTHCWVEQQHLLPFLFSGPPPGFRPSDGSEDEQAEQQSSQHAERSAAHEPTPPSLHTEVCEWKKPQCLLCNGWSRPPFAGTFEHVWARERAHLL